MGQRLRRAKGGEEIERTGQSASRHRVANQLLKDKGVGHKALAHQPQTLRSLGCSGLRHDHAQDLGRAQSLNRRLESRELRRVEQIVGRGRCAIGGGQRLGIHAGRQVVAATYKEDRRLINARPDLSGSQAVHFSLGIRQREQRRLTSLDHIIGAEGHAPVPDHRLEIAPKLFALGVMAARHILAPILALRIRGEDRRRANASMGRQTRQIRLHQIAQARRNLPCGVKHLHGEGEIGSIASGRLGPGRPG